MINAAKDALLKRFLGSVLALMVLAILLASPARGGAVIPPRDLGDLARMSEAVLLVRAGVSFAVARGGMIYTHTGFEVLDVVSGPVVRGGSLVVETYGGVLEGQGMAVGGSPRFAEEAVYLLFLNRRGDLWQPRMLAYGLLERVEAADGSVVLNHIQQHHDLELLPRPDGVVPEPLGAYYEAPLLEHLRQVTTAGRLWNRARVEVPAALRPSAHRAVSKTQSIPEPCAFLSYDGVPIRWNAFEEQRTVEIFAEENGDADIVDDSEFEAVQNGIAAWTDLQGGVDITYRWDGTTPYTPDCEDGSATPNDIAEDQGLVQFNDPCGQIPDLSQCSGVLAFGGLFFRIEPETRHEHRDQEWNTAGAGYVVVNNEVGACLTAAQYRIMMTHELGHTLGFDHIPFGAGASIMNPSCCVEFTEIDQFCAIFAYSDVLLPGAPGPVTLGTPQDDALDQPTTVDFVWQADSASTFYHFQLGDDEDFNQLIHEDVAVAQTTHRASPLTDGEEFFWRVRGRNSVGEGPWSEVFRFTTQVAQFPPDSVVLAMPTDSAIHQPTTLTLDWNDAQRASRYHLQVSSDNAFAEIVHEDEALMQSMDEVGPLDNLTVYYWRVRASNGAGASPWSVTWRFKTVPPLPGLVAPIAPAQNAVNISPTPDMSWEALSLIDTYRLQVATTFNFSKIVFETDTLTVTAYRVGPLEVNTKYFWRVRALNAAGGGPWMGRQRFTTGTPPGVVSLVAPGDAAVDQPSTIETLVASDLPPGQFSFVWEAADKPSGVYLARLHAGSFKQTRQLLLLK